MQQAYSEANADIKMNGKAVTEMDKANKEYLMDIFKVLTTEMPEELMYREDGDIVELRLNSSAA